MQPLLKPLSFVSRKSEPIDSLTLLNTPVRDGHGHTGEAPAKP